MRPRGGASLGENIANFCHEYRLNALGVPTMQALKMGVDPSLSGVGLHASSTLASMNKPVNDKMVSAYPASVRARILLEPASHENT